MSDILRAQNGNALLLSPRSGSHSLALAALRAYWPDAVIQEPSWHPAAFFPVQEWWNGKNHNVALVVRNPVERFRSMCAHRPDRTLDEHLAEPSYGPLPRGEFARLFKFEAGLDAVAKWLGLPLPLPHEDATDPAAKPVLTPDQEARVRQIFAADIALWESI